MGLIRSLKDLLNKGRQPGSMPLGAAGGGSKSGLYINEENSMRYAAVQACVRVLSEDIAALPLYVYRRTGQGGKERATGHPLYPLLRLSPNPEMTAIAFKEALMVNVLLTGNAYAFIEMNGAGRVIALWPMISSEVTPYRGENGAIRYRAGSVDLSATEVLHIPGLGFDGLMGMSPITYAREAIGLGIAAEQFGGQFFRNGTHLGGVISVPTKLSDEAFERTRTQFQQMYRGLQNAHGVPLLEGGATYQQVGIAPEDAQFLETRKYQRSEIAGIFRVPPHMVGDLEHATFSNIEHQDISYLQRSLLPWLTRIEQNMTMKLLSEDERREYVIEHETGSFMRGDTKSRFDAYAIGIQNGILSVNEARSKENLNPVDGGDQLLRPLNMGVLGQDDGTGGDDGPGTMSGRAFKLADVSSFTTDRRRRIGQARNNAAGKLGVRDGRIAALKRALAPWLKDQADRLKKIITGSARAIDDDQRITEAINAYYKALAQRGLPGDVERSVEAICNDALVRLRQQHGAKAEAITEEWMRGFLDRYNSNMSERLITANKNEIVRLIHKPGEKDIDQLLKKLDTWDNERAENMANMETMLAANELVVAANRELGYASLWIPGPGCCKICQGLNGLTITTLKPPLHKGCTCTVTAKVAGAFDVRENWSGTTFGVDKDGKYAKISTGDELSTDDGEIFAFKRWNKTANAEIIARGEGIDDIARLLQFYGGSKAGWRKMKNTAEVADDYDEPNHADIHWYEHDEAGKVDYKIKSLMR